MRIENDGSIVEWGRIFDSGLSFLWFFHLWYIVNLSRLSFIYVVIFVVFFLLNAIVLPALNCDEVVASWMDDENDEENWRWWSLDDASDNRGKCWKVLRMNEQDSKGKRRKIKKIKIQHE